MLCERVVTTSSHFALDRVLILEGFAWLDGEAVGRFGKKFADLNDNDIEAAAKIVAGTARSMGVEVI